MSNYQTDPVGWGTPLEQRSVQEPVGAPTWMDYDSALEIVLQGIADGRLRLSRFTMTRLKRVLRYRWRKRKKPSKAMHHMTRKKRNRELYRYTKDGRMRRAKQSLHRASRHGGYVRARIDAKRNGVPWELTEAEWNLLWDSAPPLGGVTAYEMRAAGMTRLARLDKQKPFSLANCAIFWGKIGTEQTVLSKAP